MATTKAQKSEREEYLNKLREIVKPGDTLWTCVRSAARSGLSRKITVHKIGEDGEVYDWSGWVANALGLRRDDTGIIVTGCGMDMGFWLIYELSARMWPNGHGCIGEGCPSNDHNNGDRDYTPHGNGMAPHRREVTIGADHWHRDSGYALRQRWL